MSLYKRLLVDRHFDQATLQMNRVSSRVAPAMPHTLDYPLDEFLIMHRLTQERRLNCTAAGLFRPDGTGNLFVGHSGAGKSTTTRLWTAREDVEVLSDDRIIVRRDESRVKQKSSGGRGAASEHGSFDCATAPLRGTFASLRHDKAKKRMRIYGTPWHGEACYASRGALLWRGFSFWSMGMGTF